MSDSMRPHRRQPTRLPHPWDSPGKNTGLGCHFLLQCMKVKSESEVAQSYPTLSNPMDCSPPGSSVHGSFQARRNLITYHLINLCVTASLGHVFSFVSLQRPLLPHHGSSPKDGGHLGRSNSLCFLGSAKLLSRVQVMINCQDVFIYLKFNLKNFLE